MFLFYGCYVQVDKLLLHPAMLKQCILGIVPAYGMKGQMKGSRSEDGNIVDGHNFLNLCFLMKSTSYVI